MSMPPAVPSVFHWQDTASGSKVLAMWRPHGYGGQSGPSLDSVVTLPGMCGSGICYSCYVGIIG